MDRTRFRLRRGFRTPARYRATLPLVASLTLFSAAAADPPPPTELERTVFEAVRGRVAANAANAPRSVAGAEASLTPACWTSTVECEAGNPVGCLEYKVCTRLVPWSAVESAGEQGAAFIWDTSPDITLENGCKVIVLNNKIMVDQPAMSAAEESPIGQLLNEALLYHELLHCQLGIEALDDQVIVNPVCQCAGPNPAALSDAGHAVIPDLQTGYLVTAGAARGANVQALLMQVPAAGEGGVGFAFEVPVAKTEYTIEAYVPDNGNISSVSFGPIANGKVPVTGTLDDAGKAGKFVVLVDPPTSWQYLFVEVTPAPTPARTTSWGRVKVRYR